MEGLEVRNIGDPTSKTIRVKRLEKMLGKDVDDDKDTYYLPR